MNPQDSDETLGERSNRDAKVKSVSQEIEHLLTENNGGCKYNTMFSTASQ